MVLDACQTAKADKANPFGSVAARLIESGIGSVLAMNYSVLAPATRILTSAFYKALTEGSTIGQAVDAARFEMLMASDPAARLFDRRHRPGWRCPLPDTARDTARLRRRNPAARLPP